MAGMNGRRILAGGLVAGVILTTLEVAAEVAFGLDWAGWLAGLGVAAPGAAAEAYVLVGGLGLGVLAVALYAAVRPRFGAGPRTAVLVGLFMWALNCLFPTAALAAFGLLPMNELFWVPVLFPVVQFPLATLAGAWIYRESTPRTDGVTAVAGSLVGA